MTQLGDQPAISGNVNDGRTLAQSLQTTGQPPADSTGGTPPTNPPPPPPSGPTAPTIASYTLDSGVKGDGITNNSTPILTGTAAANSVVQILDRHSQIGTATANSSGAWSYTTPTLSDGNHSLVAQATNSAGVSAASVALALSIDTAAPHAPTITANDLGKAISGAIPDTDNVTVSGTAEAHSTVQVFDGTKQVGTVTADANGIWSDSVGALTDGSHSFTAKATDVAGNTSAASSAAAVTAQHSSPVDAPVTFTDAHKNSDGTVTLTGTATDNSHVSVYQVGTSSAVGTTTANSNGVWSFTTTSAVSNMQHDYTAKSIDSVGQVVASSGQAEIGSTHRETIVSTNGNDVMSGVSGQDTFAFAANFGKDVITDARLSGYGHDVIQFSKSVFDSFADVLSHATQSGHDVIIAATAGDTLTLKNVALTQLDSRDFHFT